jgi:4-hydroxy-tetrahydrodipicolinate synthase
MTTAPASAKKGFIPVMLTPYTDTGKIDFDALTSLTEYYLQAGASGLFANCLSSEMFELDDDERIAIINQVVKAANGTVPVVATGTFGGAVEDQADFVKEVYDTGVQAVIAITGLLAGNDEPNAVFDHQVEQLFQLTDNVPLGFYECPVPYKRVLSAQQLQQFVSTRRVIYHKDTSLDIAQIKAKIEVTQPYKSFGLYDAYMAHAVESLKAGSAGLSCIQGNYFPELIVWLCNNYNNPSLVKEVDLVQQFLVDHMDVMHDVYPISSKYYLQMRGVNISTFTRRNVGDFNLQKKQGIDNLYQNYDRLMQQIQISQVSF